MSKKRQIMDFQAPEYVIKMNYLQNEMEVPDNKNIILTVDPQKDDYAISNILWVLNGARTYSKIKEKNKIDSLDADKRKEKIKSIREKFASNFVLDFSSREHLLENYLKNDNEEILDATTNALGGCRISVKCGEGILDFIYADFDEIYNKLKGKEYVVKYSDAEEKKNYDAFYNQYAHYCNTLHNYEDLFAASLYTYICPPVIGNDFKGKSSHEMVLDHYIKMLKHWQSFYLELIEFCYDENYYPEILGELCPHERYYLYCVMNQIPKTHILKQKYSFVDNKLSGDTMPFGLPLEEIDKRYEKKINIDKEFKKFAKEYEFRADVLQGLLRTPQFMHICYDFSTIEEALNIELMRMFELDLRFIKCQWCGKYFVRKTEKDARYCDRIHPGTNKTCKDIATLDNFKKNHQDDVATQIYHLYYKRYSARIQGSPKREKDFNKWKFESSAKKIECENGVITSYEYDNWNFDYFPNRQGTKFFKEKK